jgi:hypothetical protein
MITAVSTKPFLHPMAKVLSRLLLATALLISLLGYVYAQQTADAPLTNAAVVKLVKAGFKEKTIIAIINSRPNRFNLETEQLIQLKHSGVSENIILAMMSFRDLVENDPEAWADDLFFRDSTKQSSDPKSSQGSGADVFGSGSNSRSQSRSSTALGGNQNEGNVTGSATVRIMRSAESGGPAKLERTPTLNNEAVIRLVEAGFSEGTIIKRIENSAADFDLSPDKLEELRKRRVTDPIIAAMIDAMNEGPTKPTSRPEREN